MTKGQTYKYDQFSQQLLSELHSQQPYASRFNFFVNTQNILKFFGSSHTAHLQAAQANPQAKADKELFLPTPNQLRSEFFNYDSFVCENINSVYPYIQQISNELDSFH